MHQILQLKYFSFRDYQFQIQKIYLIIKSPPPQEKTNVIDKYTNFFRSPYLVNFIANVRYIPVPKKNWGSVYTPHLHGYFVKKRYCLFQVISSATPCIIQVIIERKILTGKSGKYFNYTDLKKTRFKCLLHTEHQILIFHRSHSCVYFIYSRRSFLIHFI